METLSGLESSAPFSIAASVDWISLMLSEESALPSALFELVLPYLEN